MYTYKVKVKGKMLCETRGVTCVSVFQIIQSNNRKKKKSIS